MGRDDKKIHPGILFCTPAFGGMVTEHYFSSALHLVRALTIRGVGYDWLTLRNESLITRARNTCVARFLKDTDLSHLMFIDADIQFTADEVARIWNLGADVAAGCYPMKKPDAPYALWIKGKLVTELDQFKGPTEVDYAGTGFMLIKRMVFEKIIEQHPEISHQEGEIGQSWAIFDTEIVDNCYLSEDYLFCRRWRNMGGKIVVDPQVRLKHVGQYVYG
jgi:hypothetical protein